MTSTSVAVVGVACRFPGASTLPAFLANLRAGADTVSRFTTEELLAAGVPRERLRHADFVPARGVLPGAHAFDWSYFGYSPAEACRIDPQQRVFLECASAALDDAGIDPARFAGWIGVFGGCDVPPASVLDDSPDSVYELLGNEKDFLASRVAYKLELRGPALTVQTACSTSLVAVHLAAQSLLGYECDAALAGGVAVRLPQVGGYLYREGEILSRDGRCRPFDADASGTVSSGGVGVVVLKRLDDALAHGDRIVAVVRGSAVNNDGGEKIGFTAPSVTGQRDVIRLALAQAGVEARDVGYVEAHGTATKLGDRVELAALTAAFAESPERASRCWLGAVKSNLGHTGAAAGIAGLIKAACMLEHRELFPTAHFRRPEPDLHLEESPFRICADWAPWSGGGALVAGVSSFGMGGTNAHAVLESPPRRGRARPPRSRLVFCVSAASPDALGSLCEGVAERLEENGGPEPLDAAWTLATGRRRLPHRRAVVAAGAGEAAAALRAGNGAVASRGGPRTVFLFPGQGTLRPGVARAACARLPELREVFDRAAGLLRDRFGVDLPVLLDPDADPRRLVDTELQQLALFVLGYGLAAQLRAWGVTPAAMLGHSVGEYTAAAVAGVWSLPDALAVVRERGRAMAATEEGRMLAVARPPSEVAPWLEEPGALRGRGGDAVTVAVEGADQTVLSGSPAAIEAFHARLRDRGVAGRLLETDRAFHSRLVAPAAAEVERAVAAAPAREPRLRFLSCVTGGWADPERAGDPSYWSAQLRSAVRLGACFETLLSEPADLFLELGPGGGLLRMARRHPRWDPGAVALTLLDPSPETEDERVLGVMAHLWERGVEVGWEGCFDGAEPHRCSLPAHPMEPRPCEPPGRDRVPAGVPAGEGAPALLCTGWRGARPVSATPSCAVVTAARERAEGERLAGELAGSLRVVAFAAVEEERREETRVRASEVAPCLEWAAGPGRLAGRPDLLARLDRYAAGLMGRCVLRQADLRPGARLREEELLRRLDPGERMPRFAELLVRATVEEGWLRRRGGTLEVARDAVGGIDAAVAESDRLGEVAGLARLLEHCAAACPEVLAGDRTPVSVLYPEGDEGFLRSRLEDNAVTVGDSEAAVDAAVQAIRSLHARRGGSRFRVLEVGGGQGLFCWRLFDGWSRRGGVEYHFTDVSPLAVRRARQRAEELGLSEIRFEVLDLTVDPVGQGLVPGTYDAVVAYNVVHVAPSVVAALGRLASLLRADGWLCLVEATGVSRWTHLVWGFAPGWWSFDDDLRQDSPHLDAAGWRRAVAEAGFAETVLLPEGTETDHVLVLAAAGTGPEGDGSGGASGEVEHLGAELRRQAPEGIDHLLFLPGPEAGSGSGEAGSPARGWMERLSRSGLTRRVPLVITEDPPPEAEEAGRLLRDSLEPSASGESVRWKHLEVTRLDRWVGASLPDLLAYPSLPPKARLAPAAPSRPTAPAGPAETRRPAGGAGPGAPPAAAEPARPEGETGDPLARALSEVWCGLLGLGSVDAERDFFECGGESLMALHLLARVRERVRVEIPLSSFLERPTFGDLVELARAAGAGGGPEEAPSEPGPVNLLTLSPGAPAGSGTPLFLVAPAAGTSLCYRPLVVHLGGERPCYGLESPGVHDGAAPRETFEDLAADHLALLVDRQPRGPYRLGGWSTGGMVAHEMARQLARDGREVELLALLDGYCPDSRGRPLFLVPGYLLFWLGHALGSAFGRERVPGLARSVELSAAGASRDAAEAPAALPLAAMERVYRATVRAMMRYRPRPVPCRAVLFKTGLGERGRERLQRRLGRLYGGGIEVRAAPGDHWTVLREAAVAPLAEDLRRLLTAGPRPVAEGADQASGSP